LFSLKISSFQSRLPCQPSSAHPWPHRQGLSPGHRGQFPTQPRARPLRLGVDNQAASIQPSSAAISLLSEWKILSSHRMKPLSFIARSSPSSSSGRDLRWVAYWLLLVVLPWEKSSHSALPGSSAVPMGTWGRTLAVALLCSVLKCEEGRRGTKFRHFTKLRGETRSLSFLAFSLSLSLAFSLSLSCFLWKWLELRLSLIHLIKVIHPQNKFQTVQMYSLYVSILRLWKIPSTS
jgi:hypothetical protein